MNGLMLHAGANTATFEQVLESRTPSPSDTHYPIPHAKLIETVVAHVEESGWSVGSSEFGLWDVNGMTAARMFGVLSLTPKLGTENTAMVPFGQEQRAIAEKVQGLVVGVRNSHDKSFAASMAVGARVFVCDNMSFSGDIVIGRKHTLNILRDLDRLVAQAVGRIAAMRVSHERRIAAYMDADLSDAEVHDIVIRTVDAKVMANAFIAKVLEEWRHPQHPEFEDRNGWSLYNAYTQVFKGTNPLDLVGRTIRLHGLLDMQFGALEEIPEADFEVVEEDSTFDVRVN